MEIRTQARQGDIFLKRTDKTLPATAKKEARDARGVAVLAHGNATGHTHGIADESADLFSDGKERFLVVPESAELIHDEHSTIKIAGGTYEVLRQLEYTEGAIVQVED